MPLPIIKDIENRQQLQQHLQNNPGVFVIKLGAPWCGPCKIIEKDVEEYFSKMPDNVQIASLNIDNCVDIYGFLKSKKMVKGIPALLAYYEGNDHYVPDEFVDGTKKEDLDYFFQAVLDQASS